jgi:hypothetical protein
MPLSTTGLQEGDFTVLRVLKNGVMQDVLSLTASGSTDTPLGSLVIEHIAGLQSQLNAKATTAALSLAAEALGTELDSVEAQVSAVGAAVASLGAAVATKAAQSELDASNGAINVAYANINALGESLNNGYTTLEATLALKASQAALDFTTASTYTKAQVDALIVEPTDGSLTIAMTNGLQTRLDDIRDIQSAALTSIGGASQQLAFTQADLAALGSVVGSKATEASVNALSASFNAVASSLNNQISTVSTLLGTRASSSSVTAALEGKQELIGTSLDIGALLVVGNSDVGRLQHVNGINLKVPQGLTYAQFSPTGAIF